MIDYYERICCGEAPEKTHRGENHWETFDCPATVVRGNGYFASSWNDNDYAEMAATSFEAPVFVEVPEEVEVEVSDPVSVPASHARIHITQYEKSQYVKGSSKNFEVKGDFEEIFGLLSPLKDIFVGRSSTRVRVQLQNKVEGRMIGGRNLSLAGALVPDVYNRVFAILDENGLVAPVGDETSATSVVVSRPSLENQLKSIGETLDNLEQRIRGEA